MVTPAHRGGSGTPLVLIHGFTVSWRAWLPVLPALEAEHDVFAPTMPGHHGAAALADGQPASAASLADALEAQLDEAGIETAHLAGNSLGGWVSLELARRGRARSVVALSPAGAWRTPADLRRLSLILRTFQRTSVRVGPRTQAALRRPRLRRMMMRVGFERGDRIPVSELAGMFEDIAGCTVFEAFAAGVEEHGGIAAEGLDAITCPVRIAWAERDRVIPFKRYGQPLLDMLPSAEHVTLPGVGHAPMHDDPDLVVRTIREVTQKVDRGEPAAAGSHIRV